MNVPYGVPSNLIQSKVGGGGGVRKHVQGRNRESIGGQKKRWSNTQDINSDMSYQPILCTI